MKKLKFKLKDRILINILPIVIIAMVAISVFASSYARSLILERYEEQKEEVAHNVINSVELIDSGYRMLDQSLEAELEKTISEYKSAFEAAGGDADTVSLDNIKKQMNSNFDFILIDETTTIIKSTIAEAMNFNFLEFDQELGAKINLIRQSNEIHHERIRTNVVTGYLSKFAYVSSDDHKFVLEIAYEKGDLRDFINDLDPLKVAQELVDINSIVSDIRIYDVYGYEFVNSGENYEPTKDSLTIVAKAMQEKDYEINDTKQDKRYLYIDLDNDKHAIANNSKIIELIYDKSETLTVLKELSFYIYTISLLVVTVITVVLLFLSRKITKPITMLASAADKVTIGEYEIVSDTFDYDEIDKLTNAFHLMVHRIRDNFDKIENQKEQLESYNVNLAQMVEDRTEKLQKALEESEENQVLLSESSLKFERLFNQMQEGFAIHEMLYDDKNEPYDYRILDANPAFELITKRVNAKGKTIRELGLSMDSRWLKACNSVALTGKPFTYENYTDGNGKYYMINIFSIAKGSFATLFSDITAQVHSKEEISKEKRILEHILDDNISGYWDYHVKEQKEYLSPGLRKMLGYGEGEELPSDTSAWSVMIVPEDIPALTASLNKHILSHGQIPFYNQIRCLHKDGSVVWVICSGHVVEWDQDNQPLQIIGKHINITGLKWLEKMLKEERELLKATLLSIGDGVITTDINSRIEIVNAEAERLTGWTQEEAYGRPFVEVFRIVNEYTKRPSDNPIQKVFALGKMVELEDHTILITNEGKEIPIEDSAAPIRDDNGNISGAVLIFRDFTEKKEKQERIEFLSFHDQLTGVYNRRYLEEQLRSIDYKDNYPLSVVMLDVNGLKLINDAFGHVMGDRLLQKATQIIQTECRTKDIVARYGGDEFVILMPKTSSEEVDLILQRMVAIFANESIGNVTVSISCGWGTKREEGENISDIFKIAEDHMYRRKLSESKSMRYKTIEVILRTLHEKSEREKLHSEGVQHICEAIGTAIGFSIEDIRELGTAGLMHDIGKIAIDLSILDKPGSLNQSERIEIERHPELGYQILRSINEFARLSEFVLAHHERWDGTGYPRRLRGEEIPLEARIIAVADTYHAMTSDRPYRKALSKAAATDEILRNAGTQFDPVIARLFVNEVAAKL